MRQSNVRKVCPYGAIFHNPAKRLLIVLTGMIMIGCTPMKEIDRPELIKLNRDNFRSIKAEVRNVPPEIPGHQDSLYASLWARVNNYKKKYLHHAHWRDQTVAVQFVTKHKLSFELFEGDSLVGKKIVKGKLKKGYFYKRPRVIIFPFPPLFCGYDFDQERIGFKEHQLVFDFKNDYWMFALLAGNAGHDQSTQVYSDGTLAGNEPEKKLESAMIQKKERRHQGSLIDHGIVEAGVWIPVGNLTNKIGVSPSFGLWVGKTFGKHKDFGISIGTNFFVPVNAKPFEYQLPDSAFTTRIENYSGVFGLQASKSIKVSDKAFFDCVDLVTGFGFGFFQTANKQPKTNPKDNDAWYSIDTMHFSWGVTLRKTIFTKSSIGVAVRYNLVPPSLFQSHVADDFGSSSMTTALQFRF